MKPLVLMTLGPREMTKKMEMMGLEMQLKKKKLARMRQSVKRTRSVRTGNLVIILINFVFYKSRQVAVRMDAHIPKDPRNKAALSVLRWASQNDCKLSFFPRKCLCVTNARKPCTVVVLIFKTLQQVFTPLPSSPASSLVQILFLRP